MNNKNTRCLLIVNPESGTKKIKNKCVDVVKEMNLKGWDVNVCITLVPGDIEEIIVSRAGTFDIVVCCGGDGTLNQTAKAIEKHGIECKVGYIPCGTTNDFATGLGLPLEIEDAAKAIVNGDVHYRDYGIFNESGFMYTASFGMFTESSYSASQEAKNVFGNLAYFAEALKDITKIKSYHCQVEVDGQTIEDDFVYGGVSNSPIVAGGMLKFNGVATDDGFFEVLLIRMPKDIIDLNGIIFNLLNSNYDSKMITLVRGKYVNMEFEQLVAFTLDGEYGGLFDCVKIANKKGKIHLLY